MLSFLNITITIAHCGLIVFNLTGWIWKKTRRVHLASLALILASWFLLGFWKGWGYCPLTEWHWQIKKKLGETDLPNSFIKYIADKVTGQDFRPALVDTVTMVCLCLAVLLAVYVNFFVPRRKPGNTGS